jgi:hypothetical protein
LIIRLRRQLAGQGLDAGAHTIAWHLDQQHQLTVSEATIWRTLQRAGLITPEPKKKPKTAYISFAAEQPNECGKPISPTTGSPDPTAPPVLMRRFCAFLTIIPATPSPSPATNQSPGQQWSRCSGKR